MNKKPDYYEVLGVGRDASDKELKRSYRRLARECHPDLNPGDDEAEARFKLAAEAYEVLTDPGRRERYDRFGHEGMDSRRGGQGAGFESVEDIFSQFDDLFGDVFGFAEEQRKRQEQKPRRGEDLTHELDISFEEAVFGTSRTFTIERHDLCPECDGEGAAPGATVELCPQCEGLGEVTHKQGFFSVSSKCSKCQGRGELISELCQRCEGEGVLHEQRELKINIPAGVDDGTRLKARGEGGLGHNGGGRGDVVIRLHVEPSPVFERDGLELHLRTELSMPQAALGCQLKVPTLDEPHTLEVPAGAQYGDTLRLEGAGVPHINGEHVGDLIVHLVVQTPTELSDEARALLDQLAALEGVDLDAPHEHPDLATPLSAPSSEEEDDDNGEPGAPEDEDPEDTHAKRGVKNTPRDPARQDDEGQSSSPLEDMLRQAEEQTKTR